MANKKSAPRTKAKTNADRPAPASKPIPREVWAAGCVVLGLFTVLGYFVKDYWLIDALCLAQKTGEGALS